MRSASFLVPVVLPVIVLGSVYALACASDPHQPATRKGWKSYFASHVAVSKRLPTSSDALPTAKMNPWGGGDSQKWTAEAVVANAASAALNAGWAQADVKDVLVAVPLQMSFSSLRPYGDGQTNAAVGFGPNWIFSEPPLVASLIQFNSGSSTLNLHFESAVIRKAGKVQLRYGDTTILSNDVVVGQQDVAWSIEAGQGPQWGDLFTNRVSFVQVPGSGDWFPIDFRNVVKTADEMLAQIPSDRQALGKGGLLDPELVSVQKKAGDAFPFQNMGDERFGQDINADRYFPVPGSGIHNEFPTANGDTRITAVGHGNTLVMIRPPSPFKLAYICFDKRDPDAEAKLGVPSGGGWHEIGDPAETVMNTLEKAPVVFGYANGRPVSAPPSGQFAYGLADIAVIRELRPGFALITAGGDTTRAEDASGWQNRGSQKNKSAGRNYH